MKQLPLELFKSVAFFWDTRCQEQVPIQIIILPGLDLGNSLTEILYHSIANQGTENLKFNLPEQPYLQHHQYLLEVISCCLFWRGLRMLERTEIN